MSDVETRGELADILKDNCALRSLLVDGKPCLRAGSSGVCTDCLFGWEIVAKRILKLLGAKRSAYEQEREKVKILTDKVELLERIVSEVFSLGKQIGDGFATLTGIVELAKGYKSGESEKQEKA